MIFLASDGGGTKLQLLAFDEDLHLLAHARGPAVTDYYIPGEQVRRDMEDTVRALLEQLPGGAAKRRVFHSLSVTTCSVGVQLEDVVRQFGELENVIRIREAKAGVLAGLGRSDGQLTLSGTGSDCFIVDAGDDGHRDETVGGYGPVLGDEGSGYDLGRQALMRAIRCDDGLEPPTLLRDYIFADYGLQKRMFELVSIIHRSSDSRKQVARATYPLGRAARAGDATALAILENGGKELAHDAAGLLRRAGFGPDAVLPATVSGGAWKIHPLLWQTYRQELLARYPKLDLRAPAFDPVMGGVAHYVLCRDGVITPAQMEALKKEFSPFVLDRWFVPETAEKEG